jgi:hypothetical protein
MVPVVIGLLASLIGLGGISEKIREFILKVQDKVDKAIDKVIAKVIETVKKLFGAVKAGVGKMMEWWKSKKKFKTLKGETHTLSFKGEGRSAKLMIASTEKEYLPFVINLDTKNDSEKQKAKKAAIETAKKIDSLTMRTSTTKDDVKVKDETLEFEKLTQQLAEQTQIFIDRTDDLPASALPQYGPLTAEGYATSMKIEPLTKIGAPGTVPSASSARWERLNMRKETSRSYYIRGHMLNHNIHGPGTTWKNLTPLSQVGNKNHLRLAEKDVKEAVNNGDILHYQVVAIYNRNKNNSIIDKLNKANIDSVKKVNIETVIQEEQFIPSHLLCHAYSIENDEKTGKRKVKKIIIPENTVVLNQVNDNDIKQYNVIS